MATQTNLDKIWGDTGGFTDPGDVIYAEGWQREIPTFQRFNFVLGTCTRNILVNAEQSYAWQNNIQYKRGATVKHLGVEYTCRNDVPIGLTPNSDLTDSYWYAGGELAHTVDKKLTASLNGIEVDGELLASEYLQAEGDTAQVLMNNVSEVTMSVNLGDFVINCDGKKVLNFYPNAGVDMAFNNVYKVKTRATGIEVAGNISIDGDLADGDNLVTRDWMEANMVFRHGTAYDSIVDAMYPIGAIFMSVDPTNPSQTLGGEWVAYSQGRIPVSRNPSDDSFKDVESTGGVYKKPIVKHTHPVSSGAGAHQHKGATWYSHAEYYVDYGVPILLRPPAYPSKRGAHDVYSSFMQAIMQPLGHSHSISTVGDSTSLTNMMPYQTTYMWKRTG